MKTESMVMGEQVEAPQVILDTEDKDDLLVDCHTFLSKVLDRTNPQWMQKEGAELLSKIAQTLSWYKIQ